MSADRLADLSAAGVSIWLDDLDRGRLESGGLAALVEGSHVVGVTTNPSIFDKAITSGAKEYAAQVHELAVRGVDIGEAIRALTTYDVRWACDVLAPVHARTGGVDGRVSIEVDPRLARATEATIAEAKALHWAVDRPNVLIKIPATVEGLPAITAVLAEGISVNVTLIFSVERYRDVMDAYLDGLARAKAAGHDLTTIHSVASFFVSRVDTEVDARLEKIGTGPALALRGKAALANARLAYVAYQEVFESGDAYSELAAAGGLPQRPLWASTGVKNPDYPDTLYVGELVAPGTVNTLPEKTLDAFADHGVVNTESIIGLGPASQQVFDDIAAAGVDFADVFEVLESEGVSKFEDAWNELLDATQKTLDQAVAQQA